MRVVVDRRLVEHVVGGVVEEQVGGHASADPMASATGPPSDSGERPEDAPPAFDVRATLVAAGQGAVLPPLAAGERLPARVHQLDAGERRAELAEGDVHAGRRALDEPGRREAVRADPRRAPRPTRTRCRRSTVRRTGRPRGARGRRSPPARRRSRTGPSATTRRSCARTPRTCGRGRCSRWWPGGRAAARSGRRSPHARSQDRRSSSPLGGGTGPDGARSRRWTWSRTRWSAVAQSRAASDVDVRRARSTDALGGAAARRVQPAAARRSSSSRPRSASTRRRPTSSDDAHISSRNVRSSASPAGRAR